VDPFYFKSKLDQTLLLGVKARNVQGLLEGLRRVPDSSVYFHTHRFLEQHNFLSPEPPNDFAYWVAEVLGDDILGEQLSSVDLVQFPTIALLRSQFISTLENAVESAERQNFSPPGEEFHFMASRIFVLPTPYVAHKLSEFREAVSRVSVSSLYYHIFDARLRLEQGDNDFSEWFAAQGKDALAADMRKLDPYTYTLEGLRKRIVALVRRYDTD
jgi:hypothetical protein